MAEHFNQAHSKISSSKFSSESVKTVSDAKLARKNREYEKKKSNTVPSSRSEPKNENKKLHHRHCKVRKHRTNKMHRLKSQQIQQNAKAKTSPTSLKAKICKTSPVLRTCIKPEVISGSTINSVSASDGVNCSIKNGWKFKKVLSKLRGFTKKVTPNPNFSQVNVWNHSLEKVSSHYSTHFKFSSHSWSSKKLIEKLSWRKINQQSSIDASTDQSSKSLTQNQTEESHCTTCATETDEDCKTKTLHSPRPAQKSRQTSKSPESVKNSCFGQIVNSNVQRGKSEKSIDITIVNDLKDNNNSSFECAKMTDSAFENFDISLTKLKALKSAPALIKSLSCPKTSFIEAPPDRETPKVTIVVDKTCQTTTSIVCNVDKVTTSTSCTMTDISLKYSDKEIQNEIKSLHEVNSSMNKMCQTNFSDETVAKAQSKASKNEICRKQTCQEALNEVSQLALELMQIAEKGDGLVEKPSIEPVCDHSSKHANDDKEDWCSPTFESVSEPKCLLHAPCKCQSSNDKQILEKLSSQGEKYSDKTSGLCSIHAKLKSSHECPNHPQKNQVALTETGHEIKHCCRKSQPNAISTNSDSKEANKPGCQSVGFIQQPSIMKSSSSFLKFEESMLNNGHCHACNIHNNPELWKGRESCYYDFPLTRSTFLKLYPEPYINYLSNNISNVQLIFQKQEQEEQQLFICRECKTNHSWNHHAKKHHLHRMWAKSTSTIETKNASWIVENGSSSSISRSKASTGSSQRRKHKKLQRKKIKLKDHVKYENLKYPEVKYKALRDKRRKKHDSNYAGEVVSSSSYIQAMKRRSATDDAENSLDTCFPPPPPLMSMTPEKTNTEIILPPPPPPLYEYPPYRVRHDSSPPRKVHTTVTTNRQNSPPGSLEKKQPEKPYEKQQYYPRSKSPFYKPPALSPPYSRRSQIGAERPRKIASSDSETSDIVVIPNDKRYEKEKKTGGYFTYNKPSNYLLKYPGFGDCITAQATAKFKPKNSPLGTETKKRKKIKDKYKGDGTSVRCLIRNSLVPEENYAKKDFSYERPKPPPVKEVSGIDSRTKIATLFEKTFLDSPMRPERDGTTAFNNSGTTDRKTQGIVQMSKNTFCVLSDSVMTSDSAVKTNQSFEALHRHHTISKSESVPQPNAIDSIGQPKCIKRHSEECVRQRALSLSKRCGSSVKDKETLELFRKAKIKLQNPSLQLMKLCDNVTTSDESIIEYFALLDKIAEKRKLLKKEERRKLRMQEKQSQICQ